MMNIRYLFVAVFAGLTLLTSCEHIDESDRLIEVTPTEVSRAVLVEEFSGQFCVNCPYGAAQLHRMEAEYGADSLVVVTIHCGVKEGFGIDPNDPDLGPLSLVTADGEKRFNEVGRPAQPAILVDRRGAAVGRSDVGSRPEEDSKKWLTAILNAFQLPAMVEMEGRAYQKNEGEAELTLLGSREEYRIQFEKGIGSGTLDGKEMSGGSVYGGGENRLDIDGGIGALRIHFRDET